MEALLLGALLLSALAIDLLISLAARRAEERHQAAGGGPEAPPVRPEAPPALSGPRRIEPQWVGPREERAPAAPPAPRRRGPPAPPRPPGGLPSLRTPAGARAAMVAMVVLDRPAGAPPRWPPGSSGSDPAGGPGAGRAARPDAAIWDEVSRPGGRA